MGIPSPRFENREAIGTAVIIVYAKQIRNAAASGQWDWLGLFNGCYRTQEFAVCYRSIALT